MVLDDAFIERSKRAAMRTTDRDRTACAYGTALPPDRPHPYSYQKPESISLYVSQRPGRLPGVIPHLLSFTP